MHNLDTQKKLKYIEPHLILIKYTISTAGSCTASKRHFIVSKRCLFRCNVALSIRRLLKYQSSYFNCNRRIINLNSNACTLKLYLRYNFKHSTYYFRPLLLSTLTTYIPSTKPLFPNFPSASRQHPEIIDPVRKSQFSILDYFSPIQSRLLLYQPYYTRV